MSMVTTDSCVNQIGDLAGEVWRTLDQGGPMSAAKLAKEIDAPRDLVMQAVGWLAREDKIAVEEANRGRVISLR